jgi:hypothetical protein
MNDIEFLPAWYPRRARNRVRLIIAACGAGVLLLVTGAVLLLN